MGYNRSVAANAASKVAHFIEGRFGYRAMLCPSGQVAGHYPYVSLKLMAEMAGLGTRSMAGGVVLNETYGLLYYGAALTTMPLEPDGPLETAVCPHPTCRKMWEKRGVIPCVEACPICLSGELAEGRIGWMVTWSSRGGSSRPTSGKKAASTSGPRTCRAVKSLGAEDRRTRIRGN